MRKRILIALLVLFSVVIGVVVSGLFESDPKYHGKRLSAWFEQYYRSGWQAGHRDEKQTEEAIIAFRGIGTNSVVYLLSQYYSTSSDNALRTNLQRWIARLPPKFQPKPYVRKHVIRSEALLAICEMKPPSDFIESLVTNRLYDSKFEVRIKTLQMLCATKTGTNATLPILRQMLKSADGKEQVIATRGLADLEKAAEPALPALVELIKNDKNDPNAVFTACRILWLFDNIDLSVVPALQARLAKLGETTAGFETAVTLVRIDAGQREALDLLLKVAADPKKQWRQQSITSLGKIGRNAKRAGPLLNEVAMSDTPFT